MVNESVICVPSRVTVRPANDSPGGTRHRNTIGPLAQRSEQAAHNRFVAGSNPAGATNRH